MTDCEDVRESLVLYAEGELSAEQSRSIQEHLAWCVSCRQEAAGIREIRYWPLDPDLLLNLVGAEKNCDVDRHDLSLEVERARELLRRKRMLDTELRAPEVARARELCDELENLLVSLSAAQKCESSGEIRLMERSIE